MKTTKLSARRKERLLKIENLILRGVTSSKAIAARFDVSSNVIRQDLLWIQKNWRQESPKRQRDKRVKRVKQLEHVLHMALHEYDLSKAAETEVVTVERRVVCSVCRGKCYMLVNNQEVDCRACDGNGWQMEATTTEKHTGQSGNIQALGMARQVLNDLAKLEGLTIQNKAPVIEQHHSTTQILAPIVADANNPYSNVDKRLLIELQKASARIEESYKEQQVDAAIIEKVANDEDNH